MVVSFYAYYSTSLTPPKNLLTVNNVVFTYAENSKAKTISSQQRSLPDDWLKSSLQISEGQYLATINVDEKPIGLWAIYLPVVQMNAKIYLNNILLGQVGTFGEDTLYDDPFARIGNPPFYFTLPDNVVKKGDNALKIQVQASYASGLLGKIYLGEAKELLSFFEQRYAVIVTAKKLITAGILVIAILMNVLWVLRKQDHVYGWYALMLYTWSAHNIFSMGINIPLSQYTQNILALLTLGWFVVFMVKATHHYMGQRFPKREKIIIIAACAGSLMLVFSAYLPWSLRLSHQIWSTFVLSLAGYALLDFTFKYRERDDLKNPLILPAGFFMLVFGIHDWLMVMEILPRDNGRLLHFSAPVSAAVFGVLLLERFTKVLKQAESLNQVLEKRVEEKHRQLENNYQRLKEMEHKQLISEERERFMKEIHDGVGGHLISMLSMVRNGKQEKQILVHAIEATLDDLRIMIDSLSPQEHDIPSLLGAMRMRIEPQLKASGLRLHWQVNELPAVADFGPHKALQVMRIVQEAMTNVIRHAEAKNMTIKAFVKKENNRVNIEVCDDGKGIQLDSIAGRGLGNMQYRANEIDAKLNIVNTAPGTTVSIVF